MSSLESNSEVETPQLYLQQSQQFLVAGDFDRALAEVDRALEINADYAEGLIQAAAILQRQEQLDLALKKCKQAITLEPSNHRAYAELGAVLMAQNRAKDAILVYKKALSIPEPPAAIYGGLAVALKQNGQLKKAIALYQYAVKLFPDHLELRNNLVQCLILQREQVQSQLTAEAKNIQPYSYFFEQGRELVTKGKYEAALAVYIEGNQQHYGNPFSYLILGNGYGFNSSPQKQLESYIQAIELDLSNFKLNQENKNEDLSTLNANQIAGIYQKIITGSINSNNSEYLLLLAHIASQRLSDHDFFYDAGKQLAELELKSAAIAFLEQAEIKGLQNNILETELKSMQTLLTSLQPE